MMSKGKFFSKMLNLDLVVAGVCFVLLVSLTFLGVFRRYLFNSPILWQEEVQVWLFLWIVFFGGSAAFRSRSHIAIEMVVEMFPKAVQRVLEFVVNGAVLVVLGFLAKYSYILVDQFIVRNKATSVLKIPNALITAAVPVGCALMMLNLVLRMIRDFRSAKTGGDEEGAA